MINQNGSRVQDFLVHHTVFTHAEFARWIGADGPANRRTESLLRYYVEAGRLLRPRRGLYGSSGATDPYLVAGTLSDDSILAYHTALAVHGRAHSVSHIFYHLSRRAARPLVLGSDAFETVRFPKALRDRGAEAAGVVSVDRQGQHVKVTTLERTMVDVLDRHFEKERRSPDLHCRNDGSGSRGPTTARNLCLPLTKGSSMLYIKRSV